MEVHERIDVLSRQLDGMSNDGIREELIGIYADAKDFFEESMERLKFLDCLEAAGVDNWDGVDYAQELMSS